MRNLAASGPFAATTQELLELEVAETTARYLAQEKRLLLLPGHVYGKAYEPFLRIGFGCRTEQFEEGLTTLMHELQGWRSAD